MNTEYHNLQKLYNGPPEASTSLSAMERVTSYVRQNRVALAIDLSICGEHEEFYQKIKAKLSPNIFSRLFYDIQSLKLQADLFKLASDPNKLAEFFHVKSSPETLLKGLEHLKQVREYTPIISKVVVTVFNLKSCDHVRSLFEKGESQLILLAHFVNANKINLHALNLSMEELHFIAPHLHYVNCQHVRFKNGDEEADFIKKCSNATQLFIYSDKIKVLKNLSKTLEELHCPSCSQLEEIHCDFCPNLTLLNAFNCKALKNLDCYGCERLTELNISSCSSLQILNFSGCHRLGELDLSNCLRLQEVNCFKCCSLPRLNVSNCAALQNILCANCDNLIELNASNCKALKTLDCSDCLKLSALTVTGCKELQSLRTFNCYNLHQLDLFDCKALQGLDCHQTSITRLNLANFRALTALSCLRCPNLNEINLSNCYALERFDCSECPELASIIGTSLPNCIRLEHNFCRQLRQLPQLPPGVTVISYESRNSSFVSFRVDPDDLKTNPLQVLCHLGELILKDKRMPNIVYLNSPGLDAGGLRRQLVTTLMQSLFEKSNSPLKLEAGETLNDQQIFAFKTVGALIALAALTSLPLGRFLSRELFIAILFLELEDLKTFDQNLKNKIHSVIEIENANPLSIAWMAKGFREIADPKKFRNNSNNFILRVEGAEVTWNNFDKQTTYQGTDKEQIKEHFKTFFERNPHKVNDMVELFTASRALGEEKIKIIIDYSLNQGNLFEMTTCNSQVNIPPYKSYLLFEEKLLKSIEHSLGQFGKA